MKLSDGAPVDDVFHEDETRQVIQTAETALMTAFTIFAVGSRVPIPGYGNYRVFT